MLGLRAYFSEIRFHQHDFNPRSVDVGVVHLHKAVSVVIVCGEAGFSDAAFGYGLNLYARKRTHGCDDFAISISNLVFVLVDDAAGPGFPTLVAPVAADGEFPFPSLSFFDGVLDIRKGLRQGFKLSFLTSNQMPLPLREYAVFWACATKLAQSISRIKVIMICFMVNDYKIQRYKINMKYSI